MWLMNLLKRLRGSDSKPQPPPQLSERDVLSRFPFLAHLEREVAELMQIRTADKLAAFQQGAEFWTSPHGQEVQDRIARALAATGYPEASARYELSLVPSFLSREGLEPLVTNPAALHGGTKWLDGEFTESAPGVFTSGFPVGPLLIVGSGNSLMPAFVAAIEGVLANCPVVLRGSRVNQQALESIFEALGAAGDRMLRQLVSKIHPIFLDHQDPVDAQMLRWLLRNGPFDAGNFWGGQEALHFLIAEFAKNPRHPVIIPMEPMTGVAVISQTHLEADLDTRASAARGLAHAMTVMGQQLCSSPTEGYFIGRVEAAVSFARQVAAELEQIYAHEPARVSESQALKLDRVRNRLEENGSVVITPHTAAWTLVVSPARSGFEQLPPDCHLPIHNRSGFLELIVVGDLDEVAERIAALPAAPCHKEIRRVQTVVRFTGIEEAKKLASLLRPFGIYRIVPPEYVMLRHALEPLDGRHLIAELTRQMVVF